MSLEVWLEPSRVWDFATFLAFYTPDEPSRLAMYQWQTGLLLRAGPGQRLQVDDVFPRKGPAFLTITGGSDGTAVYVNGKTVKRAPDFRLSGETCSGWLVFGDSPRQSDSWTGTLFGLAFYSRALSPNEVQQHFLTWTRHKEPDITAGAHNVALYLLDEGAGNVVRSRGGRAPELYIPQRYTVLDQVFLESPWSEFRRNTDFWGAVVKNIVGFVPLGFFFHAYFSAARHLRRAALITILFGFAVSLIIEILQAFLPTRDSGTTDLITNTLGTGVGVVICHGVCKMVGPVLSRSQTIPSNRAE